MATINPLDTFNNHNFVTPLHQHHHTCFEAIATAAEERYHLLSAVNKGAYGVVYKARDNYTGKIVAVKHEVEGLSKSTLREIGILKSLPPHPSIVEFKEAIVDGHGPVLVVMEYLPMDLKKLIDERTRMPFTLSEVKLMMKQILEGIRFLHEKGVMHRDLKPANILISSSKTQLKICDFGLSCAFGGASGSHSPGVCTLCYRAPELLMGERNYSCAIDMWSVGCIMAELVLREVVYPGGSSESDQKCCIHHTSIDTNLLRKRVADAALSASGIDLLERLLELDPENRITAKDALNHTWFREFYGLHVEQKPHH